MAGNHDRASSGSSSSLPLSSARLKAVIFDYGEVLCHRPTAEQFTRLGSFFGVGMDRMGPLWDRNRGPFDRGDLTAEKYWTMLAQDAGAKVDADQMKEVCALDLEMWGNVNPSMVKWAQRLQSSGLKVGLLSNMHVDMVNYCRKNFDWLQGFDFLTFSGEVRLIKPDPEIYEHTLRGLGVKPHEAMFLDDREPNVKAARELGIHAIRMQSVEQLRKDLQASGFAILPESA